MKKVISYRIDEETLKEIKARDTLTNFLDEAIKYRIKWLKGQEKQQLAEKHWDKKTMALLDEAAKLFKQGKL